MTGTEFKLKNNKDKKKFFSFVQKGPINLVIKMKVKDLFFQFGKNGILEKSCLHKLKYHLWMSALFIFTIPKSSWAWKRYFLITCRTRDPVWNKCQNFGKILWGTAVASETCVKRPKVTPLQLRLDGGGRLRPMDPRAPKQRAVNSSP